MDGKPTYSRVEAIAFIGILLTLVGLMIKFMAFYADRLGPISY